MSKKDDLEKADQSIKEAEANLRYVKGNLESLEQEIELLVTLETQLVANVNFLKRKYIIALAHEYRKAREDLGKTRARLILVRFDRQKIVDAFHKMELIIFKTKQAYEEALKESENNVIKVNFGRKNGQG